MKPVEKYNLLILFLTLNNTLMIIFGILSLATLDDKPYPWYWFSSFILCLIIFGLGFAKTMWWREKYKF